MQLQQPTQPWWSIRRAARHADLSIWRLYRAIAAEELRHLVICLAQPTPTCCGLGPDDFLEIGPRPAPRKNSGVDGGALLRTACSRSRGEQQSHPGQRGPAVVAKGELRPSSSQVLSLYARVEGAKQGHRLSSPTTRCTSRNDSAGSPEDEHGGHLVGVVVCRQPAIAATSRRSSRAVPLDGILDKAGQLLPETSGTCRNRMRPRGDHRRTSTAMRTMPLVVVCRPRTHGFHTFATYASPPASRGCPRRDRPYHRPAKRQPRPRGLITAHGPARCMRSRSDRRPRRRRPFVISHAT